MANGGKQSACLVSALLQVKTSYEKRELPENDFRQFFYRIGNFVSIR